MWPDKCWGEWNYHILWSAGSRLTEAAHNTICLCCCKSTRPACVQLVIHWHSHVLLPPIILLHLWLHIMKAKHRSSQSFWEKREVLSFFYPKAQWLQPSPAVQETWVQFFPSFEELGPCCSQPWAVPLGGGCNKPQHILGFLQTPMLPQWYFCLIYFWCFLV